MSCSCRLAGCCQVSTELQHTFNIRVRTSTGQRSFALFGRATWNSLPPSLRAPELSLSTFKRLLKTRLFQHAWTFVRRRCDWTASWRRIQKYPNSTQLNVNLCSSLKLLIDWLPVARPILLVCISLAEVVITPPPPVISWQVISQSFSFSSRLQVAARPSVIVTFLYVTDYADGALSIDQYVGNCDSVI